MEKIPSLFKCGTLASRPESGEVVVVVGGLSLFEEITLPACEMDRARSISSIEARGRFLAARRLVRGVLSAWFTMEGSDVPIQLSDGGKPYVAVKAMPRFSISHSADLVAAAFYESDAGIDLEVKRSLDHVALARRFFSQQEAQLVASTENSSLFFRLWTCREAAIKASGKGMASLLESTRVTGDDGERVRVDCGGSSWEVIPWEMTGGYHAAVAFADTPRAIRWCDLRTVLG
jgi:4'-phosphopantetheinyl transferase